MNEALIDSVIDQVDAHEKKINELNGKTAQKFDYTERLNAINNGVDTLRSDVKKLYFPQKEMQQLSDKLERGIEIFRQPVKQEIKHHHHASKGLWATGILFLMVCIVSLGCIKQ
jgi:predicted RNase H-like nuclease (RuvC/YqgF family)